MGTRRTLVIVGAGLAGTRAATTLREVGFEGRVVLLGEEPVRPYDRVTLSKHYLYRKPGFHGLFLHDETYYAESGIELRTSSRVESLDTAARTVTLSSGEGVAYDALLLATGAGPRRWTGPGADLRGVHYLRTLADADALRTDLEVAALRGRRLVVIGAGWVGCEVAAAAWELGVATTLVGRSDLPLQRVLGTEMATFYRDLHADHGVAYVGGRDVIALHGTNSIQRVELADGTSLPADIVVVGIGGEPRTRLAEQAGLEVSNGIVTDEYLRTTAPGVYAAGDCAMVHNVALGRHSRLEHFSAAFAQGPAAARSMLGAGQPYSQIPFFFSDQYDVWMEYTGDATGAQQLVVRTLPGEQTFIAFWLRDRRLAAGMNINVKDVPETIRTLIASGMPINPATLADPDIPLDDPRILA